jgi:hypothetical protein
MCFMEQSISRRRWPAGVISYAELLAVLLAVICARIKERMNEHRSTISAINANPAGSASSPDIRYLAPRWQVFR